MQRFLESNPHYPKDLPNGELRPQSVVRLMSKVLYAGYLEAPSHGVSRRKAQHEPIISLETFEKIQERRQNNGRVLPNRQDVSKDFVLRGAVCCHACNHPYTAGWSKGKYKKYPYYFCQQRKCTEYGKSIPRAKLEGDFEQEILKHLQPTHRMFQLVGNMLKKGWEIQADIVRDSAAVHGQEAVKCEKEISKLIERIMEADNARVIAAYEERIDTLEKQKLIAQEKAQNSTAPQHSFREALELSMLLLSNPRKIWDSGRFAVQRIVLKLAFSDHLVYRRNQGYRTPRTSLPFKAFSDFLMQEKQMVPFERGQLNSVFEELADWEAQLKPLEQEIIEALGDEYGGMEL